MGGFKRIWAETKGNEICLEIFSGWQSFDNEGLGSQWVTVNPRGGRFHIHTCVFRQSKCQNLQLSDRKIMHYMGSYRFWMNPSSDALVRTWRDKQNACTSELQFVKDKMKGRQPSHCHKEGLSACHLAVSYCSVFQRQRSWGNLPAICSPACKSAERFK